MKLFVTLPRAAALLAALSLASTSFAQVPPGGPGAPGQPPPKKKPKPGPRPPVVPGAPVPPVPPHHRHHPYPPMIPVPPIPPPPEVVVYHSHSSSDSISASVQRKLRKLGYYNGSVDGDIGPKSRAAIRAYQEENGLEATGQINRALLASLGL